MLKTISRNYPLGFTLLLLYLVTAMPGAAEPLYAANGSRSALKKGTLLVASRHLIDPNFEQSVILLTQHNEYGSTGIIINKRAGVPLEEAFPEMLSLLPMLKHLYFGGPVARSRVSLLVQSGNPVSGANEIITGIFHIDTQDLFRNLELNALDAGTTRLFSGYAGWSPGQLRTEMQRGDWHTWPAEKSIIFSQTPGDLWKELIDLASARWVMQDHCTTCPVSLTQHRRTMTGDPEGPY